MDELMKIKSYSLPKLEKEHPWITTGKPIEPWTFVGEFATLMIPVKVFRKNGDFRDVHDDEGNCLTVSRKLLHKPFTDHLNTEYNMKAMKDAVLKVARELAEANNTVTTLEIKSELRRDYPYYFWTQDIVSNFMSQLAGDGLFTYTDTGVYRIYSLTKPVANVPTTSAPSGISKVAGTIPTAPSSGKVIGGKKGRPRKTSGNTISRKDVIAFAEGASFESVTVNGMQVGKLYIKAQKKSIKGYITPKLNKVEAITLSGKTYLVK